MRKILMILAVLLIAGGCRSAQSDSQESGLRMSQMYTDGMVLQRNVPLVIKGHANAGEKVKVTLDGPFGMMTRKAKASKAGDWDVEFKPLDAAVGITLTIEGNGGNTLVYDNVAAG
jgi:sialate O-acetylesterase